MNRRGLRLIAAAGLVLVATSACGWKKPPRGKPEQPRADRDRDGLADATETALLSRFRPFYRFSTHDGEDEDWHPADASWFVAHSDLQDHHSETDTPLIDKSKLSTNQALILTASSKG